MVEAALDEHDIPVALHLDHGPDFETCKMCIDNGFSSVMIDGSKYDFEENVKLTKQVVEYAHKHGVVVEAELGKLAGIEDEVNVAESDALFTDPEQAREFVERTRCDSLAIAIGTSHGAIQI
jgi:fruc_bis_ald_: fructose-1,6-bisphosphate aldolase, class II